MSFVYPTPIDDGLIADVSLLPEPVTFNPDRDDLQEDRRDSNNTMPEADHPAAAKVRQQTPVQPVQRLEELGLAEEIRLATSASLTNVQSSRCSTGMI